jgi:hypothetical protein
MECGAEEAGAEDPRTGAYSLSFVIALNISEGIDEISLSSGRKLFSFCVLEASLFGGPCVNRFL